MTKYDVEKKKKRIVPDEDKACYFISAGVSADFKNGHLSKNI